MDIPLPLRLESYPFSDPDEGGLALMEPEIGDPGAGDGSGYRVILYDDDWHHPKDVHDQLIKATGCSSPKAVKIIHEVEAKGRGVCFKGDRQKCHNVARILREIRLQCEVDCD